jgi:predicted DNA-binding protein (MmcQ/YjbR family)
MNIENIRDYCLSKKEATESFPFGDTTLVFKVFDKMFALMNLDGELSINLKCDPEKVIELCEKYTSVLPGYHMNKRYWISVLMDGTVPDKLIKEWIDHSYEQVIKGLPIIKQNLLNK